MKQLFKNKLVKNSSFYLIFNAFEVLIPLFILPFITKKLSTNEYGIYVLFSTMVPLAVSLLSLGINDSLVIQMYKLKRENLSIYFSSNFLSICATTIFVGIFLFLAKAFFFPIIQFPENLFFPILSVSFFQIFYSIALQYFRFIENPPMYGFFSICFSVLKNGLSVGFLYLLDLKLDGLIYSSLLSGLFFFLFSLVIFQINGLISFKFDFKSALDCLRLGLPLLLHQLGTWLASSSIKLVISTLLGVAITGSFSISLTISLAILFIQDSFNKAFMPYLFEKLKDPDFHKIFETKIIKLTYLVNLILLLISIAYGIFSYFVIDLIFGVKYLIAKDVIILLSISYAFEGMYKMHVNYLFFKNRTDLVFVITLTSGILNILLSYFLIREFGIIGAGMSLLVSNIYSYLICWYLSNRVFPMNWLSFSKWL